MPVQYAIAPDSLIADDRPLKPAMLRGWRKRCPQCGIGHIFSGYTKVKDNCENCGLELFHQRADDAPPYFTCLIVGHITIPLLLIVEQQFEPPQWLQLSIFLPFAVGMTLWMLPKIKGALVGLQWAKRMHGFGGVVEEEAI